MEIIREQLAPGATKEMLTNPKIFIFTAEESTQKVIDAVIDSVLAAQNSLAEGEPWRVVYDVSNKKVAWTPYFRKRTQELAQNRPDLTGRYAVVVPSSFFAQLMQLFMQINLKGYHRQLDRRMFFKREDAIQWVGDFQG